MKLAFLHSTRGAIAILSALTALTALTAAFAGERVGVYDSRVVAYAAFWESAHQADLRARMVEGKAAKEQGDTARFEELRQHLVAEQKALHLQVFSTAPVPDAMARLAERAMAIEHATGVARLVSKWDDAALRGVDEADRVDVTELLVRDCQLTEAQRNTMREIGAKAPLPLWRAKLLSLFGRM